MTTRVFLLLAALLATGPAFAGTVYRCETSEGRTYASKRIAGAQCEAVSQFTEHRSRRFAPSPMLPSAAGATMIPASFVQGSPASGSLPASTPDTGATAPAPRVAPRMIHGQIYSYLEGGVRHYSSKRPLGVAMASAIRTIAYSYMETCFACGVQPGVNFRSIRLRPEAFRSEISDAAARFGVDESVVRAIIHAESAYNPNAMSRVGAQGLMQLMPATARRFGVDNAFDPAQNIRGGVQYLAFLLKRFNGSVALAAAGYNAGEGAVDRYNGVPPYSETQRYVQRVSLLAERYRSQPVLR